MAALGSKLRTQEGDVVAFWCPGCRTSHGVRIGASGSPCWTFNGDGDRPTFAPSVLVTSGCKTPGFKPGDSCWCTWRAEDPEADCDFECGVCHSFVKDGQIQFLSDCTHKLAGQTVRLPDFP